VAIGMNGVSETKGKGEEDESETTKRQRVSSFSENSSEYF